MKLTVLCAGLAMGLAGIALAEDHTIDAGSSETLSENASYDRLIVNGDLTLAAGVELSVASLCVASNITGTANLTLGEGAKLTVSGGNAYDCVIAIEGGHANVTLQSGSVFTAVKVYMGLGYVNGRTVANDAPASCAMVTLNGAVFEITNDSSSLYLQDSAFNGWPKNVAASTSASEITMNAGSELRLKQISYYAIRQAVFAFNGGKLKTNGSPWKKPLVHIPWVSGGGRSLKFVSQNAQTIDLYLSADHSCLVSGGSSGCSIAFSGDGDLIVDGLNYAGQGTHQSTRALVGSGLIYWNNAGKIIFRDKIVQLNGNERFGQATYYAPHEIEISGGGKLDLNGQSFTAKTLFVEGGSVLTNTGAACTLTMDNGASDWSCYEKIVVPDTVSLVKRGSGTLTMPQGYMSNLSVQEGGISLLGRAEVGYPYYKFNVYGSGNTGGKNARVNIGELVYLNGEEDVTQGWKELYYSHTGTSYYNSPTNALDGDEATYFYDQRAQSYDSVSNIHFELKYDLPHKVTGYKWIYPSGFKDYSGHPTSWAVFGSDDNQNWDLLDVVDYQAAGWTGWTKRTCSYANAAVPSHSLTLATTTSLKVVAAELSALETLPESIELAKGAKITLGANQKVKELTIDADDEASSTIVNFDCEAAGVLNVVGTAAKLPKALPLALPGASDDVLTGWTVTYNGVEVPYWPQIVDGELKRLYKYGMILYVQ